MPNITDTESDGDEPKIPAAPVAPPTVDELAARLDAVEAQQRRTPKWTNWDVAAVSFAVAAALFLVLFLLKTFWPQPGPTTDDDTVEALLRPGPHCYTSAAEMTAARQRALAATDRIRWEQDFTASWDAEHLESAAADNYSMIPPNVVIPDPPAPIPDIVGPSDPRVPPSADPNLAVSDDVCFGVTEPLAR